MGEQAEKINIIELLMVIKEDVSSIKTDMANFKEAQRTEKEVIMKAIEDVRCDCERELKELETRLTAKVNGLQTVQNSLVGDVDNLKKADDKKDAEKYRKILAFISAGLGGMALAKLPDVITYFIKLAGN
jgi:hypothetical protein